MIDDFDRKMLEKGKKYKVVIPKEYGEPLYTDSMLSAIEMSKEYGKATRVINLIKEVEND